ATLVNYSCHPVAFAPDNLRYSADYPGAMAKYVEALFDKPPACFFLQGAAGDITPYYDTTPLPHAADRLTQDTGEHLERAERGAPFVEFGIAFRERAPVPNAFFVGYANGYYGYFPTLRAAVEGGYGANSLTTRAEVGAGEAMVDHALVKLYQILGKLKKLPSP